jgi:hypothetical protein
MKIHHILAFLAGVGVTSICFIFWPSNQIPTPTPIPVSEETLPTGNSLNEISEPGVKAANIPETETETASTPAQIPVAKKLVCPKPLAAVACNCSQEETTDVLPPPNYHLKTPSKLETNREGEVRIQWEDVPKASAYQVKLYDLRRKLVKSWKTKRTVIYLKQVPFSDELEFTPYKIVLTTLNKLGEEGDDSESRDLNSRRLRSVVAPQIESITVED